MLFKKRLTNPLALLVWGYVAILLLGTILLLLPISRRGPLSLIDALFTVTSAVCVTGLIVKDTATFYTLFGKAVILSLIQLGGIGYMTFATLILFFLGKKGSLTLRMTMMESFPELAMGKVMVFAKRIFLLTLFLEVLGIFSLWGAFIFRGMSWQTSLGQAIFHTVSAFCNAGFSTFSDNLVSFQGNGWVCLSISVLLVVGGLGFVVMEDLYFRFFKKSKKKLLLHTKVVLLITILAITLGWLVIWLLEFQGSLADLGITRGALVALFSAVTPRTAGFNTINLALFQSVTLFFIICLMFMGGSPGGTAGGVKTTAVAGLFFWQKGYFTGREVPVGMGYRISEETIKRLFSVITLGVITVVSATFILLYFEEGGATTEEILGYLFEVVSAFGTVGLSLGSKLDPYLSRSYDFSFLGKGVIILTMLIGRIGVLSIAAFLVETRRAPIRYLEGKLIIG